MRLRPYACVSLPARTERRYALQAAPSSCEDVSVAQGEDGSPPSCLPFNWRWLQQRRRWQQQEQQQQQQHNSSFLLVQAGEEQCRVFKLAAERGSAAGAGSGQQQQQQVVGGTVLAAALSPNGQFLARVLPGSPTLQLSGLPSGHESSVDMPESVLPSDAKALRLFVADDGRAVLLASSSTSQDSSGMRLHCWSCSAAAEPGAWRALPAAMPLASASIEAVFVPSSARLLAVALAAPCGAGGMALSVARQHVDDGSPTEWRAAIFRAGIDSSAPTPQPFLQQLDASSTPLLAAPLTTARHTAVLAWRPDGAVLAVAAALSNSAQKGGSAEPNEQPWVLAVGADLQLRGAIAWDAAVGAPSDAALAPVPRVESLAWLPGPHRQPPTLAAVDSRGRLVLLRVGNSDSGAAGGIAVERLQLLTTSGAMLTYDPRAHLPADALSAVVRARDGRVQPRQVDPRYALAALRPAAAVNGASSSQLVVCNGTTAAVVECHTGLNPGRATIDATMSPAVRRLAEYEASIDAPTVAISSTGGGSAAAECIVRAAPAQVPKTTTTDAACGTAGGAVKAQGSIKALDSFLWNAFSPPDSPGSAGGGSSSSSASGAAAVQVELPKVTTVAAAAAAADASNAPQLLSRAQCVQRLRSTSPPLSLPAAALTAAAASSGAPLRIVPPPVPRLCTNQQRGPLAAAAPLLQAHRASGASHAAAMQSRQARAAAAQARAASLHNAGRPWWQAHTAAPMRRGGAAAPIAQTAAAAAAVAAAAPAVPSKLPDGAACAGASDHHHAAAALVTSWGSGIDGSVIASIRSFGGRSQRRAARGLAEGAGPLGESREDVQMGNSRDASPQQQQQTASSSPDAIALGSGGSTRGLLRSLRVLVSGSGSGSGGGSSNDDSQAALPPPPPSPPPLSSPSASPSSARFSLRPFFGAYSAASSPTGTGGAASAAASPGAGSADGSAAGLAPFGAFNDPTSPPSPGAPLSAGDATPPERGLSRLRSASQAGAEGGDPFSSNELAAGAGTPPPLSSAPAAAPPHASPGGSAQQRRQPLLALALFNRLQRSQSARPSKAVVGSSDGEPEKEPAEGHHGKVLRHSSEPSSAWSLKHGSAGKIGGSSSSVSGWAAGILPFLRNASGARLLSDDAKEQSAAVAEPPEPAALSEAAPPVAAPPCPAVAERAPTPPDPLPLAAHAPPPAQLPVAAGRRAMARLRACPPARATFPATHAAAAANKTLTAAAESQTEVAPPPFAAPSPPPGAAVISACDTTAAHSIAASIRQLANGLQAYLALAGQALPAAAAVAVAADALPPPAAEPGHGLPAGTTTSSSSSTAHDDGGHVVAQRGARKRLIFPPPLPPTQLPVQSVKLIGSRSSSIGNAAAAAAAAGGLGAAGSNGDRAAVVLLRVAGAEREGLAPLRLLKVNKAALQQQRHAVRLLVPF